jgi:hypothetical protein
MAHTYQNLHITTVWNNLAPPPHTNMVRYKKEKYITMGRCYWRRFVHATEDENRHTLASVLEYY